MKLKYYMRGLGIGIVVTALIMGLSLRGRRELTDTEIKARAAKLGMVEESAVLLPDTSKDEPKETEDLTDDTVKRNAAATKAAAITADKVKQEAAVRESEDAAGVAGTAKPSAEPDTEQPAEAEPAADLPDTDPAEASGENADKASVSRKPAVIVVESGNGSDTVSRKLVDAGLVDNAETFDKYLCSHDYDYKITIGKHTIPAGSTYDEIARILISAAE